MRKYSRAMIICSLMAILSLALARTLVSAGPPEATPVGTAFTYQGQLKDGSGNPITNTCDFQFGLFDVPSGGTPINPIPEQDGVTVANGYFTVNLDFGAGAFDGNARWLDITVRCPSGGPGLFTALTPRQPLTPAPYSLYALNAGLLNNLPSTSFQQHYQNLVVVAKSGGDYTTISAALTSITTASGTNRFLVYVAPGTYTETVTMKPYVDIEGAGELATKITQTGSASANTGTVIGASNAELRFLTVENTGGATNAVAIYNFEASPRLTHITATAASGTYNTGVYDDYSWPTMTNVYASASGGTGNAAVDNENSSPAMTNVIAAAYGGTDNRGVFNSHSSPTMTNVTATASGAATNNYGVYNYNSLSPTMTNVTATASGGTNNYGVDNANSSATMTYASATASGGTSNIGVYNEHCSVTIQSSLVAATGATSNGIYNSASSGTYTVKVNNSRITAATNTIHNSSPFTTQVGASQLGGGGSASAGGGTLTCVFSYNDSFVQLGTNCQ